MKRKKGRKGKREEGEVGGEKERGEEEGREEGNDRKNDGAKTHLSVPREKGLVYSGTKLRGAMACEHGARLPPVPMRKQVHGICYGNRIKKVTIHSMKRD